MKPYIESRGEVVVTDLKLQNDAIQFITKLLELKDEIDHIVSFSFDEE